MGSFFFHLPLVVAVVPMVGGDGGVLGSALVFPLSKEGEMVEEPLRGDEDTIHGWQEPC
jgi:hypothetical protein